MTRFRFLLLTLGVSVFSSCGLAQLPAADDLEGAQELAPAIHLNSQGLPDMDCGTLDILIRHDHYTIGLLRQVYKQASRTELKALIQQMITDHKQEMARLNGLRKDWYGQPLTPSR
jgi:uncharacterized protein (DUF305 family)